MKFQFLRQIPFAVVVAANKKKTFLKKLWVFLFAFFEIDFGQIGSATAYAFISVVRQTHWRKRDRSLHYAQQQQQQQQKAAARCFLYNRNRVISLHTKPIMQFHVQRADSHFSSP